MYSLDSKWTVARHENLFTPFQCHGFNLKFEIFISSSNSIAVRSKNVITNDGSYFDY